MHYILSKEMRCIKLIYVLLTYFLPFFLEIDYYYEVCSCLLLLFS